MLSNSQDIFSELAKALYRAGLYVSFADIFDKSSQQKKAQNRELLALHVMMQVLQKQNSEDSFLYEIGKLAEGDIKTLGNYDVFSDQDVEDLVLDLESVPQETEAAITLAVNNLPKNEARLYTDILISAAASVAQAYDEKDDMFLAGNIIVDSVTFLTNAAPLYERILMFFANLHAPKNAKYLYNEGDVFDEMKISTKESDAIGRLVSSVRNSWFAKFPSDRDQSVDEYRRETGDKY